jgi:hypothetical protein
MTLELILGSIIFLVFIISFIVYLIKKEKISVKYSLVWLLPCFILLIFTLVPGFLNWTTKFLGFKTGSNMIFALLIAFLMVITISLTVIVSKQNEKIRLLIQEISLLKEKK